MSGKHKIVVEALVLYLFLTPFENKSIIKVGVSTSLPTYFLMKPNIH